MCTDNSRSVGMTETELRDALLRVPLTREGGDDFFGRFAYVQELVGCRSNIVTTNTTVDVGVFPANGAGVG